MSTDVLEVIRTKRDGGTLSDEQILFFLEGYTAGSIADEQASALLMAILFNGMDTSELAIWTKAMIESGQRMDLSSVGRPTVDKHSTGGVGDKVSLILCPLVASFGVAVPQLSGRGLGHTGGTLDKLESIPGWSPRLSPGEFIAQLRDIGAAIVAAGDDLAPADRKLYALRDVTGTVEAIPLIASSIMSKKIAEGTDALVLDVKVGSGAFLPEIDRARDLARTMVGIGEDNGVRTVALLTGMHRPLGRSAGNALEVAESVDVLRGAGPGDVRAVTIALANEMLELAGVDGDPAEMLDSGRAYEVYCEMIRAQGGDPEAVLAEAPYRKTVTAYSDGYISEMDAKKVGVAAWRLGAGRARKEDPVVTSAGVVLVAEPGEHVTKGQEILELRAEDESLFASAVAALEGGIVLSDDPPELPALLIERIGAEDLG
ncbi:MAG: thymidine phosphorylase [Acidimicrobiales bacterium]